MIGELHFRAIGKIIRPEMPSPYVERPVGGRALWGHAVPIGQPARVQPRGGGEPYMEWWQRGALRLPALPERAAFSVGHVREGGTKIGSVRQLVDSVMWVDMIALVDEGEVGDAALSHIGPDGDGFGLSIAFQPLPGGSVEYPGQGVSRSKALLTEVAIVPEPTFPGAVLYARGNLPPPMSLKSRDPRKDWVAV